MNQIGSILIIIHAYMIHLCKTLCDKVEKCPHRYLCIKTPPENHVLGYKSPADQAMTKAEHNWPIPKLFDNRPSSSAAEGFCETIGLIVSQKTSVAEAEGRLSKSFGIGRLCSASVIV